MPRFLRPGLEGAACRIDSDTASVAVMAVWLAFLGTLMRGVFVTSPTLRVPGRLLVDAAGLLLIGQSLATFGKWRRFVGNRVLYHLGCGVLGCVLFALLQGLARGPDLGRWFQMGLVGFGSIAAIFLGSQPRVFERLLETTKTQLAIAAAFVGYVVVYRLPETRDEWWLIAPGSEGVGLIAGRLLFPLPFLVAYLTRMKPAMMGITLTAYLEYLILQVAGVNRSGLLIGVIVIPAMATIITVLARPRRGALAKALLVCAGGILIGTIAISQFTGNGVLREKFSQVMLRYGVVNLEAANGASVLQAAWTQTATTFAGEGSRAAELRDFAAETSWLAFLLGRGFGVSWYCNTFAYISPQWYVVHFGPGYLLLVGGLPLALLLIALIIGALARAFRNLSVDPAAAGALLYLSVELINFLQHGFPLDEGQYYLLWLSIGFSIRLMYARPSRQLPVHQQRSRQLSSTLPWNPSPGSDPRDSRELIHAQYDTE
jgi:hypothetical protein